MIININIFVQIYYVLQCILSVLKEKSIAKERQHFMTSNCLDQKSKKAITAKQKANLKILGTRDLWRRSPMRYL